MGFASTFFVHFILSEKDIDIDALKCFSFFFWEA